MTSLASNVCVEGFDACVCVRCRPPEEVWRGVRLLSGWNGQPTRSGDDDASRIADDAGQKSELGLMITSRAQVFWEKKTLKSLTCGKNLQAHGQSQRLTDNWLDELNCQSWVESSKRNRNEGTSWGKKKGPSLLTTLWKKGRLLWAKILKYKFKAKIK